MSIPDPAALAEALQLTRSGRLAEATAVIQRALGGVTPTAAPGPVARHETAAPHPKGVPLPPTCRARPDRAHRAQPKPAPRTTTPPMPSMPVLRSVPDLGALADFTMPDLGSFPGLGFLPGIGGAGTASTTRPYRLHVPKKLPAGPRPLLVLLHGGTQDGSSFADATGFDALADVHGFIAGYPEQVTAANPMRYWNWFNRSHQHRGTGEPAILAALVEEIADLHPVDRSRVYVAGFSAGAAMASVLGATYPDVFTGIGVHSGLAHGAAGDMVSAFAAMRRAPATPSAGALPVIVIHGDADPTVHVSNAAGVLEQFAPVGATQRTHRQPVGGREVERTVVEAGGRTVAEQLIVSGAGHTWSGGRAGRSYADPSGPDAAAEMVRFFGLAAGQPDLSGR